MKPSAMSDGELALAVQRGAGEPAEQELVRRFRRRVVLFAQRHTRNPALAEDIAQDVMTKVLEKLRAAEVEDPARVGSFILGTARWTVHSARRQNQRAAEVYDAAHVEGIHVTEQAPALDSERLSAALAELPERERAVVVMSFLEDRDAKEIAEAFALTPGNVRVIRHRAILRLGRSLGSPALGEEGGA